MALESSVSKNNRIPVARSSSQTDSSQSDDRSFLRRRNMKFLEQISFLILSVLIFGQVTSAQTKHPESVLLNSTKTQKSKIKVEYDKFDDATTIRTPLVKVKENNILRLEDSFSLSLSGAFVYHGKPDNPTAVGNYVLLFEAWGPRQLILRDADKLSIIAGDKRLSFDTAGYDRNGEYEVWGAKLDKEEFETIAYASTVEMRIGDKEFSLSSKQLESFRELAQRADSIHTAIRGK